MTRASSEILWVTPQTVCRVLFTPFMVEGVKLDSALLSALSLMLPLGQIDPFIFVIKDQIIFFEHISYPTHTH